MRIELHQAHYSKNILYVNLNNIGRYKWIYLTIHKINKELIISLDLHEDSKLRH